MNARPSSDTGCGREGALRTLAAGLLLAGLALGASPARADMYSCTTASGRHLSGDTPPFECRTREIRVLNPDGSIKRVIPAPLTREQVQEREEAARRQAEQEQQERAQRRRDKALLETYGSAEEIEAARARALAAQQGVVDRADGRIRQYAKERKGLDSEAEFYAGREMPASLREKFDANARLAQQQEKVKASAFAEMRKTNEKFDADAARFRQIVEESRKSAEERQRIEQQQ